LTDPAAARSGPKRLAWFVALWTLGVASVALVAGLLRWLIYA